jgi:hypothetical protein
VSASVCERNYLMGTQRPLPSPSWRAQHFTGTSRVLFE